MNPSAMNVIRGRSANVVTMMTARTSMLHVTMANDRTNQFKILLSDEERAQLEEVAASQGLTASDVLRQYIRAAHEALSERGKRKARK